MKILPPPIEAYLNRVPRRTALIAGISCAVAALFCAFRLVLAISAVTMMSGMGYSAASPVSLVLHLVWWAVVAVILAIMAVAYLTRYARGPQ
jgi:hypothetical protein